MTLQEYVNELNEFVKDKPELADKEVHYSCDDEGNRFDPVVFGPSIQDDGMVLIN